MSPNQWGNPMKRRHHVHGTDTHHAARTDTHHAARTDTHHAARTDTHHGAQATYPPWCTGYIPTMGARQEIPTMGARQERHPPWYPGYIPPWYPGYIHPPWYTVLYHPGYTLVYTPLSASPLVNGAAVCGAGRRGPGLKLEIS